MARPKDRKRRIVPSIPAEIPFHQPVVVVILQLCKQFFGGMNRMGIRAVQESLHRPAKAPGNLPPSVSDRINVQWEYRQIRGMLAFGTYSTSERVDAPYDHSGVRVKVEEVPGVFHRGIDQQRVPVGIQIESVPLHAIAAIAQ